MTHDISRDASRHGSCHDIRHSVHHPDADGLSMTNRRLRLGLALILIVTSSVAVEASEFGSRPAPWVGTTLDGRSCADFPRATQGFTGGGLDYRRFSPSEPPLSTVENRHFTERVETLEGGENSPSPVKDLNYTLRAFPNHHHALYSYIRYFTQQLRQPRRPNSVKPSMIPPECYLQRAHNFAQKDPNVPLLFGLYLHRRDRLEDAESMYRQAIELAPSSAEAHYNLGLVLFDRQQFQAAQDAARKAYDLGYPLPGLRKKLDARGYSIDAEPTG